MLPEKRKMATRARTGALVKKPKRSPSPAPPPQRKEPTPSPSPESSDDELPTRLENGLPLPTLSEPQSTSLSDAEYQSIAESGVLVASMDGSRLRWLTESIFERYWTKPTKKKGIPEAKNPRKDLMSKLGQCTLTIAPHVFEVTLYTVKDSSPRPPPPIPPSPAQPSGGGHASDPSLQPSSLITLSFEQRDGLQKQQQPRLQSQWTPRLESGPKDPRAITMPPLPLAPARNLESISPGIAPAPSSTIPRDSSQSSKGSSSQPASQAPDPVIQMLATKAASDHALKDLMKTVASGEASSSQLKMFQAHIDGLTAILQSQKSQTARSQVQDVSSRQKSSHHQLAAAPSKISSVYHTNALNDSRPLQQHYSQSTQAHPKQASIKAEPFRQQPHTYSNSPLPVKARPAPSLTRPDISNVVFQIAGGTGDRLLFPKYSILEYLLGGTQVIASFLITRKGSDAISGRYHPDQQYYQPVTMRLGVPHSKILEPLGRVVAPQNETRQYMENIMKHSRRAERVYLASRLPRQPEDIIDLKNRSDKGQDSGVIYKAKYFTPPGSVEPRIRAKQRKIRQPTPERLLDRLSPEWTSPAPTTEHSLSGRTRRGRIADPNKSCRICHTSTTSLWRKADIEGENVTVCNACGIKWKTTSVKEHDPSTPTAAARKKSGSRVAFSTDEVSIGSVPPVVTGGSGKTTTTTTGAAAEGDVKRLDAP